MMLHIMLMLTISSDDCTIFGPNYIPMKYNYINPWNGRTNAPHESIDIMCPNDQAISFINSTYNSDMNDRMISATCQPLINGRISNNCRMQEANAIDSGLDIITGIRSTWNSTTNIREYSYRLCKGNWQVIIGELYPASKIRNPWSVHSNEVGELFGFMRTIYDPQYLDSTFRFETYMYCVNVPSQESTSKPSKWKYWIIEVTVATVFIIVLTIIIACRCMRKKKELKEDDSSSSNDWSDRKDIRDGLL